mgnify:CR=1 FL=1
MQQSASESISTDDLLERYKTACALNQPVEKNLIVSAIRRWAAGIGIPLDTPIRFLTSEAAVRMVWSADRYLPDKQPSRRAWTMRATQASRCFRNARIAWDARNARNVRAARDACDARNALAALAARTPASSR